MTAIIVAVLMILSSWAGMGCGDVSSISPSTETTANAGNSPQDRAARLAAQSQMRNAQMAQEAYFVDNNRYASTMAELRSMDAYLNQKVEVTGGNTSGYEMRITASDSTGTVYIIRQTENRIERVDGEGNPW